MASSFFSSCVQWYDVVDCHLFIRYFCPTNLTYSMVFSVNHLSFPFSDTFPFCIHVILFILFLPIYIRIRHKKMTAIYKFLQKKLLRFPTTTFQSFITLIFEIFFRPLPAALSAAITILHGHRCNALICQSEKSQRERSALLQILFSLLNLYALLRSINHLSKKEKSVPSSLMVMLM